MGKKVALLGTGIMGNGIGMNLLAKGHDLTVWNRTVEKTKGLTDKGARLADSPAAAVKDVEFIIDMLAHGPAVMEALQGERGALSAMTSDHVWIDMSTVGLEDVRRFRQMAKERGVPFVDAPVMGTKQPAEAGQLIVLAGGDKATVDRCMPLFEAISQKVMYLGEGENATKFKLVYNTWVVSAVGIVAETIALAKALGIDPVQFLETIKGGRLDMGYAQMKGAAMINDSLEASFPLELALKDTDLILSAAQEHGFSPTILKQVSNIMRKANQNGHGREDLAALFRAI